MESREQILQKDAFVRVSDHIPNVLVELIYATPDNFTGQRIYGFTDAWLRWGTVQKLRAAAVELETMGYRLKIWDAFRPAAAQFALWEVCPDDTYVADPRRGFSKHTRGFAVDVTLTDPEGREVVMPTAYDDFSVLAERSHPDWAPEAGENARLLEKIMEKHGFQGYIGEWWHFNDTDAYPAEMEFNPSAEP